MSQLHELLEYDSKTGVIIWIKPSKYTRWIKPGDVAGHIDYKGYRRVTAGGRVYKAHRLAWFMFYGTWPKCQIDHINGDRLDNRIENLREAANGQNRANSLVNKKRTYLLPKGVTIARARKPYRAQITYKRRVIYLGCFDTVEEAHRAYCRAADRLHGEFANHGDKPISFEVA